MHIQLYRPDRNRSLVLGAEAVLHSIQQTRNCSGSADLRLNEAKTTSRSNSRVFITCDNAPKVPRLKTNRIGLLMMQQVFSRINQVAIRADVVRLKMQGRLPQFTWLDVAGTWTKSCTRWPTDKLAIPADGDDPTMYQTPIGQLCWARNLRKYAGLFALEHMRGVYERGTVRVNRGDIVWTSARRLVRSAATPCPREPIWQSHLSPSPPISHFWSAALRRNFATKACEL